MYRKGVENNIIEFEQTSIIGILPDCNIKYSKLKNIHNVECDNN